MFRLDVQEIKKINAASSDFHNLYV